MSETKKNEGYSHESCGQPVENHYMALMSIVVAAGAGFDCDGIYRALVEVAETYRRVGNFEPYKAVESSMSTEVARRLRARLQEKQETNESNGSVLDSEIVVDTKTGAGDYAKLTPEQKKKFN